MLTHIVRHIFRVARPTNLKLGICMEHDDPHQPQAPWPPRSRSQGHVIGLSHVGPMIHKSKMYSRSITKMGRKVPQWHMLHCAQVSRSKIKVTSWLTQTHNMCHIFWTVSPENFKDGVQMEDVDLHQQQVPWPARLKVKIISSHRLYVSSLPLLNSGNNML